MSGRMSALKNKINKLERKIIDTENTFSFQYVAALNREIIELKQEGQCKQITIDSLEFDVDRTGKRYKNATEIIIKLNNDIKSLEDKKIKNKLKKLFAS